MSKRRRNKRRNRHAHRQLKTRVAVPAQKEATLHFGLSLERYVYGRINQTHAVWPWVGVALTSIVIGASLASGYFTNSQLWGATRDVVRVAATSGDYVTAQRLYKNGQWLMVNGQKILGADTELEELVYPEKVLERHIAHSEALNKTYPYDPGILLHLSTLYTLTDKQDVAQDYREKARILDPNNEIFRK